MAERSSRTTGGMPPDAPRADATRADTSSTVKSAAEDVSAQAKETAREGAGILRAGKDEAVREAKHMMHDIVEEQRGRAAGHLGGMAQALHKSARDLEQENTTMAKYTDMAAERLDDVAQYLRQANWNDMVHEAEGFARRQPYWFIGGAVAAGFLAARFIKSSPSMKGRSSSARQESTTEERVIYPTETAPSRPATPGYGQSTTSPTSTTPSTAAGVGGGTARTGDMT